MSPRVVPFSVERAADLVRFWNRALSGEHNFWEIDERDLRVRLLDRPGPDPFRPGDLLLVEADGLIRGVAHAGRRREQVCRALHGEDWPARAEEGYLGFLFVERTCRGRGIGSALLEAARRRLAGSHRVVADGQCLNPFWGNSAGPETPWFGTPEGVAIDAVDDASIGFFARRGFPRRHEALTLLIDPAAAPRRPPRPPAGILTERLEGACPLLGKSREDLVPYATMGYRAHCAVRARRIVGTLVSFGLPQLGEGIEAIYELQVEEAERGMGVGGALLDALLLDLGSAGVRRLEVLTIPALSPGALRLYEGRGFVETRRWCIL